MAQIKKLDPPPQGSDLSHNHDHLHPRGWGYGMKTTHDLYTQTVGRTLGIATNLYGKVVDNPIAERVTNGILQKGWRALLFLNRAGITHSINPLGSKEDFQGDNLTGRLNSNFGATPSRTEIGLKNQTLYNGSAYRKEHNTPQIFVGHDLLMLFGEEGKRSGFTVQYKDQIGKSSAYNPNDLNQVIIYNMSAVVNDESERPFIALQIRPNTIESKAETSWAAIKSMGRNTPMYHYLGAEDTLQINTSWYLKGKPGDPGFNPYWVINQCRALKAWSMANGYVASPPILYIEWGRADIFQGELWILTSATYHLNNFSDKVVSKQNTFNFKNDSEVPNKQVELLDFGLVPFTATQELIFKRVASHSLLTPEIANFQEPKESETPGT